ncbi:MAG: IPT/TIG domain-containing protein [Opitutales bacterium]|nr:IPT/TIG domain-containing protein [Opitutales bacterium]
MKTRHLIIAALALSATAFTACQSFVQNLTPSRIEANASDIYTFRVKVDENMRSVIKGTMNVEIVINGETHLMRRDEALGKFIWMYEYQVPSNVSTIPYYFILKYQSKGNTGPVNETVYSTDFTPEHRPYSSNIINRYVAQISSSRGPVGATIGILGQGFTEFDRVMVGEVEAPTSFVSHSQLNFTIPPIAAGQTYNVSVRTGDGDLSAGMLRVDAATIGVQPTALSLGVGDSVPLTFFIEGAAPAGGLIINVTTDIPNNIVMPVVVIPAGQRSVSVTVQGLSYGSGHLWISAEGYQESKLPISVQ